MTYQHTAYWWQSDLNLGNLRKIGKSGNQPLIHMKIADMETLHIKVVLNECGPIDVIAACMKKELEQRDD